MVALHPIRHSHNETSTGDRLAALETENAELRARLERVEFVLRNLATAAAFVDHPPID